MAIGRDGLGLELAARTEIGPLAITELSVGLPKVKFPVDVSGGVARFRHRRGDLLRLTLELPLARLEALLRERLRGLIGTGAPECWVGLAPSGATLAVLSEGAALAFDVVGASFGGELRLFVTEARGVGLPRPAVAIALQAMGALVRGARRHGSTFIVDDVAARVTRALLPEAGVRVPDVDTVRATALSAAPDAWIMHLSRGGVPPEPSVRVATVAESAELLASADDALAAGELDKAREACLAVLTRAPRHPGACLRIADIDRATGERTEAALAMLNEASGTESAARTLLRAELLARTGDADVAINAFSGAAEADPAPLFAARAFERAAELARDPALATTLLDRAVTLGPTLTSAREKRLARRLVLGRVDDAFADALELEAQARSTRARYEVWRRAADAFLAAGLRSKAGALFERSLRYVPDEPRALAGLGRALVGQGKIGRGARMLARAVDAFGDRASEDRDRAALELAQVIAGPLADAPAAIARLEAIADTSAVAPEARAREAALRTELGDLAGAAFAWARLRNYVERLAGEREMLGERGPELAELLVRAARFEREVRRDDAAAQRHLLAALRVAPSDAEAGALLREIGAAIVGPAAPAPPAAEIAEPPAPPTPPPPAPQSENDDPAFLEARADELTRKLQGDPTNDVVADELTRLLIKLGRSHEVFALVSARADEATPERRPALRAKQREILRVLAEDARAAGNDAEAQLFASFADGLPDD